MATREQVELVYEYWDCRYCGTKGIRGDVETCQSCRHARDADITFYRKEGADEVVKDEKQKQRFSAGPDWVCSFCQTLNHNHAPTCRECRATRQASEENYFQAKERKSKRQPKGAVSAGEQSVPKLKRPSRWWKYLLGAIGLFIALVAWMMQEHPVGYQVESVHWKRVIPIDRYKWTEATDWADLVSGDDVQKLSSSREIRRYEKRQVGTVTETYTEREQRRVGTRQNCSTSYESTGSGASVRRRSCTDEPVYESHAVTRTRQVPKYQDFPIYDTKVRYRAKRYERLRIETAEGTDNSPRWPPLKLEQGEDGRPDREGTRQEEYTVRLRLQKGSGPKTYALTTSEERFTSVYKLGTQHQLMVNNVDGVSLAPPDHSLKAP